MVVDISVCSALVRLPSSINDVCGPFGYRVKLLNNDSVLKNMTTDDLDSPMPNLAPDTNYTVRIAAIHMDSEGVVGITRERVFGTAKPSSM